MLECNSVSTDNILLYVVTRYLGYEEWKKGDTNIPTGMMMSLPEMDGVMDKLEVREDRNVKWMMASSWH